MTTVSINHPVVHITQQDENYCWACVLAMMLRRHSWNAALEIADRVSATARNLGGGQLLNPRQAAADLHLGYYPTDHNAFTPALLARHLQRGPVAVFGVYRMAGRKFSHVNLVTMLRGDLHNPATLSIGLHDSWGGSGPWIGSWSAWVGPNLIAPQHLITR